MWGCLAKVGFPDHRRTNIGSKTFDTVFIGYAGTFAAYRFMSLSDYSICESRDAEFFERVFPLKSKVDIDSSSTISSNVDFSNTISNEHESMELRRSKRQRV